MTKISLRNTIDMLKNPADAQVFVNNLSEQLQMAGQVQRDFLPAHLPNLEHVHWGASFFPAEWVSGDIYDVARLDEQHIGFYVADVVGHGIPAALLTIFLKQALVMRETIGNSYHLFPPAAVMSNLNQRMTEQKLSANQFATCCYCLLNTRTLQLTHSRGGHPYPVLIRKGQAPRQLQTRGSLLGVFERSDFEQQTIQLQRGDKLLLYSDGADEIIGEADDHSRFRFSKDFREIQDLPIGRIIDKFDSLVEQYKETANSVDDITAVGLEIL